MAKPKRSMADRLMSASVAISNALSDEEVKTLLAVYGYDETRLGEGKTLLDSVNQLQQIQQKEYGDQFEATSEVNNALQKAEDVYIRLVKVARIALKNEHGLYQQLDLGGRRKFTFNDFVAQAKQFYLNALASTKVLEKMASFGMTQAIIEEGKNLLDNLEVVNAEQEKEKGEAQQATIERDKTFEQLDEWMGDFINIARIALEEKSQLLEKLGIVKPS